MWTSPQLRLRRRLLDMMKFEINWLEDRSDDGMLAEIRRVAALEPGVRLTVDRFNAVARIKSTAVRERFGSWTEATRRAGLTDALPAYNDEAILSDIQRVSALSNNDSFTLASYSKQGHYSDSTIKRRFGGWREALGKAGLGDRYIGPQITDRMRKQAGREMSNNEILEQIRDVAARLCSAHLSGSDVEANSQITQSQMYRRFGSVSAALRKAGVEQVPHGRRYSENEVFENLLTVWTHYGRSPTALEMDRSPSSVGKNAYITRYGGWRNALKAFVERVNSEVDGNTTFNSDDELPPEASPARPTPSGIAAVSGMRSPQLASTSAVRSRAAKLTTDKIQPEDRRDLSIGLRFKVLQRDRFKCVLCGDHPARNTDCILHVDHVIPWSKGGKTREDNLRTLCATCNVGRGNRFVD